MADNNLDDTKVLPRTFFINEEDCQENLQTALDTIREKYSFDEPWIIKPGEFSNRGKGIAMGYGEKDIIDKVNGISEARKKACILV